MQNNVHLSMTHQHFSPCCAMLPTHPKGRAIDCIQIALNTSSFIGGVTVCWVNGAGRAAPPTQTARSDTAADGPIDNGIQEQSTGNTTNDAKECRRTEENRIKVERRAFMMCVCVRERDFV